MALAEQRDGGEELSDRCFDTGREPTGEAVAGEDVLSPPEILEEKWQM